MKAFKFFINHDLLLEAKIDDFVNRYLKYHKDHSMVVNNEARAKELIGHAHQFAQGHDESIFLTRQMLDGAYKPGEDDDTIKTTLGKWRKAKTEGLVGGKLSDHSHESVSAIFRDIPQLNLKKRHSSALQGMEKYKVGTIDHSTHGTLDVYNIRKKNIQDDSEYANASSSLRKTCSGSNWCVLPQTHGPEHLKHYSHGPGIFFYVNREGTPVLSHGFGDRGIVRPDNSVIDQKESDDIKLKTSTLLKDEHKNVYDFFNNKGKLDLDLDQQNEMYNEFGTSHGAAHFLDPKMNTHPQLIHRIIDDAFDGVFRYQTDEVSKHIADHPNFNSSHVSKIIDNMKTKPALGGVSQFKTTINLDAMAQHALNSTHATDEQFNSAIDAGENGHSTLGIQAVNSIRAKPHHIKRALSAKNVFIRIAAAKQYHKLTDETSSIALNDSHHAVVDAALKRKDLKPHHFEQIFNKISEHNVKMKKYKEGYNDTDAQLAALDPSNSQNNEKIKLLRANLIAIDASIHNDLIENNRLVDNLHISFKSNQNVDSKTLHKAIDLGDPRLMNSVLEHPNVKSEHAEKILDFLKKNDVDSVIRKHSNISSLKNQSTNLNIKNFNQKNIIAHAYSVLENIAPLLTKKVKTDKNLKELLSPETRITQNEAENLSKNEHLDSNHYDTLIDKVLNHRLDHDNVGFGRGPLMNYERDFTHYENAISNLINNPSTKPHHIATILKADNRSHPIGKQGVQKIGNVLEKAAAHPKLSAQDHDHLFNSLMSKMTHPEAANDTGEYWNLELDSRILRGLIKHPNFGKKHLDAITYSKVNGDKSTGSLTNAHQNFLNSIKFPAFLQGENKKLLTNEHHEYALKLPLVQQYSSDKMMPDTLSLFSVHYLIGKSPPSHISELINNHPSELIKNYGKLLDKNLSSDQLHHIIKTESSDVISSAVNHPNIKREHFVEMTKHKDPTIRMSGRWNLDQLDEAEKAPVKESIYFSVRRILMS